MMINMVRDCYYGGLINALRIVDKDLSDIKVVLNGAGEVLQLLNY